MRQQVAAVILVGACVLASATASSAADRGGARSSDPRTLAVNVVKWNFLGQYGRVWQLLHPRYQRVTTRAFWESCKRRASNPGIAVKSIKAIDSYADEMTLPLIGHVKVEAVTLQMRFTLPALSGVQTVSDTAYWTRYRGQWKGLWQLSDYRAYRRHRCPTQ
jgi:hypothetical protein